MSPRSVWLYGLLAAFIVTLTLILLRSCSENVYDRPRVAPPAVEGVIPRE
jgi:hypothetical protein